MITTPIIVLAALTGGAEGQYSRNLRNKESKTSKPKGADCNKICSSASGKTAIPGLKNCRHFCICTEAGRGDKVMAAVGKIWSVSKGIEVSAPGDASDCPGRSQADISEIEEVAAKQIIKDVEKDKGVNPDQLALRKKLGVQIAKDIVDYKMLESDDDEDSEEETKEELGKKITDNIMKEAAKRLPAYSILKEDVIVKADDNADSEGSKFALPELFQTQSIVLHFNSTRGEIYKTCPEKKCEYGLWGIVKPQPKLLVVLKKIGQDGQEDETIRAVELNKEDQINKDNLEFVGDFTSGQYQVSFDNVKGKKNNKLKNEEKQDPTPYLQVDVYIPRVDNQKEDEAKKEEVKRIIDAAIEKETREDGR